MDLLKVALISSIPSIILGGVAFTHLFSNSTLAWNAWHFVIQQGIIRFFFLAYLITLGFAGVGWYLSVAFGHIKVVTFVIVGPLLGAASLGWFWTEGFAFLTMPSHARVPMPWDIFALGGLCGSITALVLYIAVANITNRSGDRATRASLN